MTATITPPFAAGHVVATPPSTVRPVWLVGAVSGVAAALATTAVALGAKALDVPMKAAPRTEEVGRAIPLSGYAMGTLLCTAIGTVLAIALARLARRPATIFLVATIVLTVASFAGPITTGHATTATAPRPRHHPRRRRRHRHPGAHPPPRPAGRPAVAQPDDRPTARTGPGPQQASAAPVIVRPFVTTRRRS